MHNTIATSPFPGSATGGTAADAVIDGRGQVRRLSIGCCQRAGTPSYLVGTMHSEDPRVLARRAHLPPDRKGRTRW